MRRFLRATAIRTAFVAAAVGGSAVYASLQNPEGAVWSALDDVRFSINKAVYGPDLLHPAYNSMVQRLVDEGCALFVPKAPSAPANTAAERHARLLYNDWRVEGRLDLRNGFTQAVRNECVPLFNGSMWFSGRERVDACINDNTRNVYKYFHYFRCSGPSGMSAARR